MAAGNPHDLSDRAQGPPLKRALAALASAGLLLTACGGTGAGAPGAARSLIVFAAASLTEAFTELGASFEEAHPDVKVMFSFAGSQTLRTQIEAGATVDVFASANSREIDELVTGGMTAGAPRILATNGLIVIVAPGNPGNLQQLSGLAEPGLKLVLAAEDVPAGNYARQSLNSMASTFGQDFEAQVLANVVSNENDVRQVLAKVELGEADAGIVYGSDASGNPGLLTISIPSEFNVTAEYPIVVMHGTKQEILARQFVDYALSPVGTAILKRWGFEPET